MTVHYHGTPVTPRTELRKLAGRSFCVSFSEPRDVRIAHEIGEGVMLDNGAYSAWRQGRKIDWAMYVEWVSRWLRFSTTWCVIPDVIDGTEKDNDRLLAWWFEYARQPIAQCAPVWHLHESIDRLRRLASGYPRICFGSSGEYAQVGSVGWHERMVEAFNALYRHPAYPPRCWFHMLRGMSLAGSDYPFASVDSTDLARNHHIDGFEIEKRADRWDSLQCPGTWERRPEQRRLFLSEDEGGR